MLSVDAGSKPAHNARTAVGQRVALLRWLLPLTGFLVAVFYQLGPAQWVLQRYGSSAHYALELLFYGITGPLVVFWTLSLLNRWLEQKDRAEKQARAIERRLASITAASADAILGLDVDGRIESGNHGVELILGYLPAAIQSWPLSRLLGVGEAAEMEFRSLVNRVRQAGFVRGHETICRHATGRLVPVELTATNLADEVGRSFGMSVILRDITERKQREQEIRQFNANLQEQVAARTRELAEKVEELAHANAELQELDNMRSEFVSLASHQLRAPLTNIRGAAERMEAACRVPSPTCIKMVAIINEQIQRLDGLVRHVLSAARIEAGKLLVDREPVSVLPVLQQVVEQMRARTAGRSIRVNNEGELPLVYADRDRVAEVLVNLLDNADKYSPSNGEIVVQARANETEVAISVRDRGPGVPPADLERVFEKFYRTDSSDSQAAYGYGLGLYVCRLLVQAQGGRIWAANHPDGGAVFSFTLPVAGADVLECDEMDSKNA